MADDRNWCVIVYGEINKEKITNKLLSSFSSAFREKALEFCEQMQVHDVFKLAQTPARYSSKDVSVVLSQIDEELMEVEDSDMKLLVIFINDGGTGTVESRVEKKFGSTILLLLKTGFELLHCSRGASGDAMKIWVQEVFEQLTTRAAPSEAGTSDSRDLKTEPILNSERHNRNLSKLEELAKAGTSVASASVNAEFNAVQSERRTPIFETRSNESSGSFDSICQKMSSLTMDDGGSVRSFNEELLKRILFGRESASNILDYLSDPAILDKLNGMYSDVSEVFDLLLFILVPLSSTNMRISSELQQKTTELLKKLLSSKFLKRTVFDFFLDCSVVTVFCSVDTFRSLKTFLGFLRISRFFCRDITEALLNQFCEVLHKIPLRFWAMVEKEDLVAALNGLEELKEIFFDQRGDNGLRKENSSPSLVDDTISRMSTLSVGRETTPTFRQDAGEPFASSLPPGLAQWITEPAANNVKASCMNTEGSSVTNEALKLLRSSETSSPDPIFFDAMEISSNVQDTNEVVPCAQPDEVWAASSLQAEDDEDFSNTYWRQAPESDRLYLDASEEARYKPHHVQFNSSFKNTDSFQYPRSPDFANADSTDKDEATSSITISNVKNEQQNQDESPFKPAWKDCDMKEPPEDFRVLNVALTAKDILHPVKPYVRPNKVVGKYDDQQHYLDVQFRLLREDFLCPLRDGIAAHRQELAPDAFDSKMDVLDEQFDMIVLKNVFIEGGQVKRNSGEVIHYVKFQPAVCSELRMSGRLKFGQMVALSSDGFREEALIATIAERSEDQFSNGRIGLCFTSDDKIVRSRLYILIESPSYFEMYQYVLNEMKTFDEHKPVPFARYLVNAETDTHLPTYVTRGLPTETQEVKREISVFGERYGVDRLVYTLDGDKIGDGLDDMQKNALCYALSTEFAIIQGPPGTGKTFLGRLIVRILFENLVLWNPARTSPILVVCYTNHALDQFLEGILEDLEKDDRIHPDFPSVVRLGSRTNSEILKAKRCEKRDVVDDYKSLIDYRLKAEATRVIVDRNKVMGRILELIAVYSRRNKLILSYKWIQLAMSQRHRTNFEKAGSKTFGTLTGDEIFSEWLTLGPTEDEKKRLAREMPSGSESESDEDEGEVLYTASEEDDEEDEKELTDRPGFSTTGNYDDWGDGGKADIPGTASGSGSCEAAPLKSPEELLLELEEDIHDAYHTGTWDLEEAEGDNVKKVKIFAEKENPGMKGKKIVYNCEIVNRLRMVEEDILKAQPLTFEEVEKIKDVYTLHKERRWMLYAYWREQLKELVEKQLDQGISLYRRLNAELKERRTRCDEAIMRKALVIGATTTGAAKARASLNRLNCPIVVVEEAAEVLEAHVLTSIPLQCQHAILIGDHQQLRPNPAVYELARECNLDISMFERLIKNGYEYKMLCTQHRMAPIISNTLMRHFYPDLEDAKNVSEYPEVKGVLHRLFFVNHNEQEMKINSFSHQNDYEADFVVRLTKYFLQQGYSSGNITILCTYSAQASLVRRMSETTLSGENIPRIDTVDSYQGEENQILIVSLVRSYPSDTTGFLAVANRVCVALSRAQHGFYMVGNMDFLAEKSSLWNKIGMSLLDAKCIDTAFPAYCSYHDRSQWILCPSDFNNKVPNGGCDMPCGFVLPCGHQCQRKCHRDDVDHKQPCTAVCGKPCTSSFKHPCSRECGEPCGPCNRYETKQFPCGHSTGVVCRLFNTVCCDLLCQRILSCGHMCLKKCGEPCGCSELVERALVCGHMTKAQCDQDVSTIVCRELLEKKFKDCGHSAMVECSKMDTEVCHAICGKPLPFKCGHKCNSECSSCMKNGCPTICLNPCTKVLECGHYCKAVCGEACSKECQELCDNECSHLRCKESFGNPGDGMRRCKDRCIFCMEDCPIKGCNKRCWEPCKCPPPDSHCSLSLKCGHGCLGIASEVCPDICSVCSPDELRTVVGSTTSSELKLLQFRGCGCIVTVQNADKVVQQQAASSQIMRCPKCSVRLTVLSSQRYASLVMKQIIRLEKKKYEVHHGADRIQTPVKDSIGKQLMEEIRLIRRAIGSASQTNRTFLEKIIKVIEQYIDVFRGSTLNALGHETWTILARYFSQLGKLARKFTQIKLETVRRQKFQQLFALSEKVLGHQVTPRNSVRHEFTELLNFLHNYATHVFSIHLSIVPVFLRKIHLKIQVCMIIDEVSRGPAATDLSCDEMKELYSTAHSVLSFADNRKQQIALDAFQRKYTAIYAEHGLSHLAVDWANV